MNSETQLTIAVGVAVFTSIGWLVSIIGAVLKGREWVEAQVIKAIKSSDGRSAVLEVTRDRFDRIEEKIDSLAKTVQQLGEHLGGQIIQMSTKIDTGMERLNRDAHDLDKRLFSLEEKAPR